MAGLTYTEVQAAAEAHRAALRRGDRELRGDAVGTRLLHALVAESAVQAKQWVVTRAPDGDRIVEPLAAFAADVAATDRVGSAVRTLDEELFKRARSAVVHLVLTGTAPLWLAAAGSGAVAFFTFAYDVGFAAGTALLALLAVGGGATGAIVRTAQHAPRALSAVSGAAVRTLDGAATIGASAARIYDEEARSTTIELYQRLGVPPVTQTVLPRVRGYAQAIVVAAWGALVLGVIAALAGVADAVDAARTPGVPLSR